MKVFVYGANGASEGACSTPIAVFNTNLPNLTDFAFASQGLSIAYWFVSPGGAIKKAASTFSKTETPSSGFCASAKTQCRLAAFLPFSGCLLPA